MRPWPVLVLLVSVLSGCAAPAPSCDNGGEPPECEPPATGPVLGEGEPPVFTQPKIIDPVRSGGEPVIAITAKGTILVAAHPGYTHVRPTAQNPGGVTELVTPSQAQSYLWRSTDQGATWTHVGGPLPSTGSNSGPRGQGHGVSDPDFTITAGGRIYFTDLEALAAASLSWSDDDGLTWLEGNDLASEGAIDRQWLASHGETLYFTGNYLAGPYGDRALLATTDGQRMEHRGNLPADCGGDFLADPRTGHLFASCRDSGNNPFVGPLGLGVSTDGGKSWSARWVKPRLVYESPIVSEPAVDTNGTVYLAANPEKTTVVVAYTSDLGKTWATIDLGPFFPELAEGTWLWPWVSAGSTGRLSVTFLGSPTAEGETDAASEWFVYNAIVLNATEPRPVVYPTKISNTAMHRGGMCQGGTLCQATTAVNKNSDRRLGDFFETTIDREGFVHIVHADTEAEAQDAISHVSYVRMVSGPRLLDLPAPAGFPTQG